MQIVCWKCPLFIASYRTVSLLLSLISEVQQRSAELPNVLLDTRQFSYAFKWHLIFILEFKPDLGIVYLLWLVRGFQLWNISTAKWFISKQAVEHQQEEHLIPAGWPIVCCIFLQVRLESNCVVLLCVCVCTHTGTYMYTHMYSCV